MKRGAVLLSVFAAACAGARPPIPPQAAVAPPPVWRGETAAPSSEAAPAAWWRSFGDPTLTGIVETALANNTDIAIAAARVAEARGQFRLARAQRGPNVAAVAQGGRDREINPGFGIPEQQSAGEGELSISYDVDLFGRLASASKSARAALLASEAARDNVRLAVAASAASGYITLRALDQRLAILHETLDARAGALAIARRRAEAGYSTQLELAQAEAEYQATQQLIPATELAIARQEDGLALLLGDNPHAIARGQDLEVLSLPTPPVTLPAALLRQRPDIMAAEQQVVAADRSLDSARAAFLPDFRLAATGGYIGSSLIEASPIGVFSLGGSILAPLFDSGRHAAQQNVAAARRDQAAFAYRKTALTAFREVEDALAAVQRTSEQETALSEQRDVLNKVLTLATNRYRAGYSPYLDQLDAQRGLLSAQLSLAQARADRLNALVQLYQSLGGGWTANASKE